MAENSEAETPSDRPMTGPLTRDDGRRTEHGLSPLDPCYAGTVLKTNKGVKEGVAARKDAGLDDGPARSFAAGPEHEKDAAAKSNTAS